MDPNNLTPEQRKELEEKLKNMSPEEIADLQRKQCIFCQIVNGKIPSKKIYEDDICLVVLDIRPATKGHCLILPKEHFSIMPQIPEAKLDHLFTTCKVLSKVLLKSLRSGGTNIFIANGLAAGQRAPHFMIHLIPRKEGDGLFNLEENGVDLDVQKQILESVLPHFNKLMGIEMQSTIPEIVKKEKVSKETVSQDDEDIEEKEENSEEENDNVDDSIDDADDDESTTESDDTPDEVDDDDDSDESDEDDTPVKNEDDTDASLDDIANLFK
jgi:histidine triad (HIT) family protein